MDYWVYPWPVEIINEAAPSAWFAPVLTFLGSVVLFAGSLFVMWRTNRAAFERQTRDLAAARATARLAHGTAHPSRSP